MKKIRDKKKSVAEIVRYVIAGVTTTLLNIGLYRVLVMLGLDYMLANLTAIVSSKIYGYLVNKLFVFKSRCSERKELYAEIGKYIGTRGITGIVDYVGLIVLVEVFNFDIVDTKYGITVVVIVLNYLFGKFLVFKNVIKKQGTEGEQSGGL